MEPEGFVWELVVADWNLESVEAAMGDIFFWRGELCGGEEEEKERDKEKKWKRKLIKAH